MLPKVMKRRNDHVRLCDNDDDDDAIDVRLYKFQTPTVRCALFHTGPIFASIQTNHLRTLSHFLFNARTYFLYSVHELPLGQ